MSRLQAGETALVLWAGGWPLNLRGLARAQADARVLVNSSRSEKIKRAKELGAEAGVEYTAPDWPEEVRSLTGGTGVDVVIDSVGSTWQEWLRCLRNGGRCVVLGATRGERVKLETWPFYLTWKSLLGTTMGSPRDFARLLEAVEQGNWLPVVDSVRPLSEAAAAHERMEPCEHFGKLVLAIG